MFDWYICVCRHSASYWLTVEGVLIKGQPSIDWDVDRVLIKMLVECRSRCQWSVNWGFNKGIDWGYQSNGGCLKNAWSNFNIKAFQGVLGSCNVTHGSKYQCSLLLPWTFLTNNYTVAILKISNIYLPLKNSIITIWKKNWKWLPYCWNGPFWTFALNTCIFKLGKFGGQFFAYSQMIESNIWLSLHCNWNFQRGGGSSLRCGRFEHCLILL